VLIPPGALPAAMRVHSQHSPPRGRHNLSRGRARLPRPYSAYIDLATTNPLLPPKTTTCSPAEYRWALFALSLPAATFITDVTATHGCALTLPPLCNLANPELHVLTRRASLGCASRPFLPRMGATNGCTFWPELRHDNSGICSPVPACSLRALCVGRSLCACRRRRRQCVNRDGNGYVYEHSEPGTHCTRRGGASTFLVSLVHMGIRNANVPYPAGVHLNTERPTLCGGRLVVCGVAGFSGCVWCAGVCVCWCAGVCFVRVFYWVCYAVSVFVCFSCVVSCAVSCVLMDFRLPS